MTECGLGGTTGHKTSGLRRTEMAKLELEERWGHFGKWSLLCSLR